MSENSTPSTSSSSPMHRECRMWKISPGKISAAWEIQTQGRCVNWGAFFCFGSLFLS